MGTLFKNTAAQHYDLSSIVGLAGGINSNTPRCSCNCNALMKIVSNARCRAALIVNAVHVSTDVREHACTCTHHTLQVDSACKWTCKVVCTCVLIRQHSHLAHMLATASHAMTRYHHAQHVCCASVSQGHGGGLNVVHMMLIVATCQFTWMFIDCSQLGKCHGTQVTNDALAFFLCTSDAWSPSGHSNAFRDLERFALQAHTEELPALGELDLRCHYWPRRNFCSSCIQKQNKPTATPCSTPARTVMHACNASMIATQDMHDAWMAVGSIQCTVLT